MFKLTSENKKWFKKQKQTKPKNFMVLSLRGVVASVVECGREGNEFELLLCYYVLYRAYTVGKGMNVLIPYSYRLIIILTVLQQG